MTKTIRLKWPKGVVGKLVPLYGGTYYFADTLEKFNQMFDYLTGVPGASGDDTDCLGCAMALENPKDGGALYLIGVFDGGYGVLAHEVGHLTTYVLERAGVPMDVHTTEAFCYLLGYLFEDIQPLLDKSNLERVEAELESEVVEGKPVDQKKAALVSALKPSMGAYNAAKGKGVRRGRS